MSPQRIEPVERPRLDVVLIGFLIAAAVAIVSAAGVGVYYAVSWDDPTGDVSAHVPPDPESIVPELE